MRWQYKVCLCLLLISWTAFLGLAAYNVDSQSHRPGGKVEPSMIGYSGIWYHFEQWSLSLVCSSVAAVFGLFGLGIDIKNSGWKISDFIQIEIIREEDEDELEL